MTARGATGGRLRWKWPAHYPCPALARRQPPARPIMCRCAARRLPINRAGRRRAGPKSRASRAVRVPRRCLWTWQDDPAARAMRGASGCAGSLLHGLACSPACSLALSILLPAHVYISPGGEEGTHASRHPPRYGNSRPLCSIGSGGGVNGRNSTAGAASKRSLRDG